MTEEQGAAILKELEMLRKLKLLELLEQGYTQGQLAKVLGVSQPTISRMVPNAAKKAQHDD